MYISAWNHDHSCKKKSVSLMVCCLPMAELVYLTLFTVLSGASHPVYPVCTPDAQVLFLSGARMLHTQHSAVQALLGGVQTAKSPFLLAAPSSSTQTPFPSREKSAVLGIRTGDLSDQSQAL
jgi:hypothetical protein